MNTIDDGNTEEADNIRPETTSLNDFEVLMGKRNRRIKELDAEIKGVNSERLALRYAKNDIVNHERGRARSRGRGHEL